MVRVGPRSECVFELLFGSEMSNKTVSIDRMINYCSLRWCTAVGAVAFTASTSSTAETVDASVWCTVFI